MGRVSSKQGPAKLLGWRGHNWKAQGRIAESMRDVLGKSFLGPWREQQCKMKTLQQDVMGPRQEVSALEKADGDSNTGDVPGERWGRPRRWSRWRRWTQVESNGKGQPWGSEQQATCGVLPCLGI